MKFKKIIGMLMLAGLTACACEKSPSTGGGQTAGPKLVSTNPENGSTDISTGSLTATFTFDQNIKCPVDKRALIKIEPEATISSIGVPNENLNIVLADLQGDTEYKLTVPEGCVLGFKSDQAPAAEVKLTFKTKAAPVPVPEPDIDVLPEKGDNIAWQMAAKLGAGWNLGNQMDASVNDVANETCWGNPMATQATFTKLKAAGFKTVRIPITWMGHIGEAPEYTIEKAWLDRVAEIVGYAKSAGLNCIINTHHDENHNASAAHWQDIKGAAANEEQNKQIRAEIKALWGQIAERFKNEGEWLIFEGFNEINDGGWGWSPEFRANPQKQYDILNDWNQDFVDAVRATGGNNATRWLGVVGYAANPDLTMQGLVLPKDDAGKLMVGVHCYDPAEFAGAGVTVKYDEWGHSGAAGKKPASDESDLRKTFAKLHAAYVEKGIPCYLGESGCVNKTTTRGKLFQKYYLEYFSKAANSYGMPCIIWDNGVPATTSGEAFGYINHGTGEFIGNGADVIPGYVKGQNDNSASYTLDSVYANAPK